MKYKLPDPVNLIRKQVRELHEYVPGEQPAIQGLIKLNTNENPYPPSPQVLESIKNAVDARLRLYPNPTAQKLRERLAEYHGCSPENIIVGNGSDELLALATRAFVEPLKSIRGAKKSKAVIQYLYPCYSLYPVLADIHGAKKNPVRLEEDFSIPSIEKLKKGKKWDFDAALTYITTPNAPGGRGYSIDELETLCRNQRGVVILDEAYVDFGEQHAMSLALKYPHVIVSRTFSKAYSLCFLRVGYFVGNPVIINAMHKVRDSYNVNGIGQIAAIATLDSLDYYRENIKKIKQTRSYLTEKLTEIGFKVFPSQTNFIFTKPPVFSAKEWLEKLREKKILVRWFDIPFVNEHLRITIGTMAEAEALYNASREILGK
jgi:histidinol-phosphate aminotransferase